MIFYNFIIVKLYFVFFFLSRANSMSAPKAFPILKWMTLRIALRIQHLQCQIRQLGSQDPQLLSLQKFRFQAVLRKQCLTLKQRNILRVKICWFKRSIVIFNQVRGKCTRFKPALMPPNYCNKIVSVIMCIFPSRKNAH